jgi:methylenetetrahydrofolate dehydrogenase (NADP+) / methenyltetrahydrofolate cyclohydrolase
MAHIVDGRKIAEEILFDLKERVQNLKDQGKEAALAVILVGDDQPSHTYVRKKGEAASKIGITFFKYEYPANISKDELIGEILRLQKEHQLSGMILQLPVPEALWPVTREIANHIQIEIDVDCLSHTALGRVFMNESPLVPPTPGAIMQILKYHQVDLQGKEICIVGRGDLIGKPLTAMLAHYPVTVITCGRATSDLAHYTSTADVIITGVGKKDLVTGDMIKKGAVVVDAGVCFVNGKMYGDIHFDSVAAKASLVTPTPGGVGPLTVAKLLENTVKVAELSR